MAPRYNTAAPFMLSGHCGVGRHDTCVGRYGQGAHWISCPCECGHGVEGITAADVDEFLTQIRHRTSVVASPTYGCAR